MKSEKIIILNFWISMVWKSATELVPKVFNLNKKKSPRIG